MDGELWFELRRTLSHLSPQLPNYRVQYSHRVIVLVFLWAVLHDRPIAWACNPQHWPSSDQLWPHPSPATMSRRLRTAPVQQLLNQLLRQINRRLPASGFAYLDGKPLIIGGASRDPDAGFGRAAGATMAKGYKLHALWDSSGAVQAWEVQSLPVAETRVAPRLLPALTPPGWVIADANYDDNALYELAGTLGLQLLAGRRRPRAAGVGHRVQSVYRQHALRMLADGVGGPLLVRRRAIERQFGSLANFPGGLGPLPNWVRRLPRVRRWVQGKLIFNALRIVRNKQLTA